MPDSTSFTNPFLWPLQMALKLAPTNLNQSILPGWSFLTINENNSTSPETEQYILAKHSYGRQIGRMMDVVAILAEAAPDAIKADHSNKKAFEKFEEVVNDVKDAKEEAADIRRQRLLEDLRRLKKHSPGDFDALIADAHQD